MIKEREELLEEKDRLERRSIVEEGLTIGGVYHLLKYLEELNEKLRK